MRRLVLTALLAASCARQAPVPSPAEPTPAAEPSRPLGLWEVRRPDVAPSYLFGTCHLGVSLDEALPDAERAKIRGADRLVLETDLASLQSPSVQARLELPAGQRLDELLGEETWTAVLDEFSLHGQADRVVDKHPYVLMTLIGTKVAMRHAADTSSSSGSMDLSVSAEGMRGDVAHHWLETPDEQMDVLLGRPLEDYLQAVRDSLDPAARKRSLEQTLATLELCRSGDSAAVEASFAEADPTFLRQLLTDRNARWLPDLDAWFADGNTFAAVGAAHLVGEDNLLDLLAAEGWELTQLHGTTRTAPTGQALHREPLIAAVADTVIATACSQTLPIRDCFQLDASTCAAAVDRSVPACAERLEVPGRIAKQEGVKTATGLGMCAGAALSQEFADQLRETPECAMFRVPR